MAFRIEVKQDMIKKNPFAAEMATIPVNAGDQAIFLSFVSRFCMKFLEKLIFTCSIFDNFTAW